MQAQTVLLTLMWVASVHSQRFPELWPIDVNSQSIQNLAREGLLTLNSGLGDVVRILGGVQAPFDKGVLSNIFVQVFTDGTVVPRSRRPGRQPRPGGPMARNDDVQQVIRNQKIVELLLYEVGAVPYQHTDQIIVLYHSIYGYETSGGDMLDGQGLASVSRVNGTDLLEMEAFLRKLIDDTIGPSKKTILTVIDAIEEPGELDLSRFIAQYT